MSLIISTVRQPYKADDSPRLKNEATIDEEAVKKCSQSLAFKDMDDRYYNINTPYGDTCTWIAQDQYFKRWMSSGRGLLWIKGKPGAGKSTLLKHVLSNVQSNQFSAVPRHALILTFFFNGRGSDLQKSAIGMFRSLLHQLLSHAPKFLLQLVHAYKIKCSRFGNAETDWHWSYNELKDLFLKSVSSVAASRQIYMFVDALDECGEDAAAELAETFGRLIEALPDEDKVAICFTCRHYPIITLDYAMEICLDHRNHQDIADYVYARIGSNKDLENIAHAVAERACGIFQWASLVTDRVLSMKRKGYGAGEIYKAVQHTPKGLFELFSDLLQTIPEEQILSSLRCMQWIYFAIKPLSPSEFLFAINIDPDDDSQTLSSIEHDCDEQNVDNRLKTLSCGLAEIKHTSVQFIHQSVRDFFLNAGFKSLDSTLRSTALVASTGHDFLLRCCIRCLHICSKEDRLRVSNDAPPLVLDREKNEFQQVNPEEMSLGGISLEEIISRIRCETPFNEKSNEKRVLKTICLKDRSSEEIVSKTLSEILPDETRPDETKLGETGSEETNLKTALSKLDVEVTANGTISNMSSKTFDIYERASLRKTLFRIISNYYSDETASGRSALKLKTLTEVKLEEILCQYIFRAFSQEINSEGTAIGGRSLEEMSFEELSVKEYTFKEMSSYETTVPTSPYVNPLFLHYVCQYWPIHARNSDGGLLNQGTLIEYLNWPSNIFISLWISIRAWIREHCRKFRDSWDKIYQPGSNTNLLHVCAAYNISHPIKGLVGEKSMGLINRLDGEDGLGVSPLLVAAIRGNVEAVRSLVNLDVDLEECYIVYTPLGWAAHHGHMDVVEALLRAGALVNTEEQGYPPIIGAVTGGSEAAVKRLISWGAFVDKRNHAGSTALMAAARIGHLSIAKLLIENGAETDAEDKLGLTPLVEAAANGHVALVKLLRSCGARVLVKYQHHLRTPIWLAAFSGHAEMIELLLEYGADPHSADELGHTPLSEAARLGYEEVVKLLLLHVDEKRQRDKEGRTCLAWAAHYGRSKIMEHLIDHGFDVNSQDNDGRTPISLAAQRLYGDSEILVKLLKRRGADINMRDNQGRTPLMWAAMKGDKTTLEALVWHDADVNQSDNDLRTPLLHLTVQVINEFAFDVCSSFASATNSVLAKLEHLIGKKNHRMSLLSLLLEHGAETNSRDISGNTALSTARRMIDEKIIGAGLSAKKTMGEMTSNNIRTPLQELSARWYIEDGRVCEATFDSEVFREIYEALLEKLFEGISKILAEGK